MSTFAQDLRYGIRAFARTPGLTAAAILSLAIGIGANTAIYSVASALLLRPLPYADAERLVILWNRSPGLGITEDWFSTAQYYDVRTGNHVFDAAAIAIGGNYNLTGDGDPERIGTVRTSSNLLPMLGVRPILGRLFTPADDMPGAPGAALLRFGTWRRRYGGDPHVVGRSLTLNGQPYEVAGVLPESFTLPREVLPTLGGAENAEIVITLPLPANAATVRNREDYNIVAKLKPGVSIAQAQADMDAITARLRHDYPAFYPPNGGLTFGVVPLEEQVVGEVRRPLSLLMGSVAFVLLIACANVANLLLSRAVMRQKEIAVRAALGAGRARIVRQLLTESVALALAGGALGLLLAQWTLEAIGALAAGSVPRVHEIAIDQGVLLFTAALSIAAGVLFGLAPALRLRALDLHETLKDAARGSAGAGALWGRGHRLRRLLVAFELALSVMLLVGAGLLVRSFVRVQQVSPGFNPSNTLTLELTMTGRRYNDPNVVLETYRQLWERLSSLPGVAAAGGVSALPLSQMFAWGPITIEGRTPPAGETFINADQRIVAGDYFRAMEIPLLEGRLFTDADVRTAPRVAVIDAHMKEQFWPSESPIGRRMRTGGIDANPDAPWITIVGVVGRVKHYTLESESRIAFYLPHTQIPTRAMNVVMRSATSPDALAASARAAIRELDPDLPIYNVQTLASRVDESLAARRFSMLLLALFAAFALGLAAVGTYGLVAYLVGQATREVGIRIALGATPWGIVLLVVRNGMAMAAGGIAAGIGGAYLLTRFMRSLLFGVSAVDPLTFAAIPLLLAAVAFLATYVPARRAARIDPAVALRSE